MLAVAGRRRGQHPSSPAHRGGFRKGQAQEGCPQQVVHSARLSSRGGSGCAGLRLRGHARRQRLDFSQRLGDAIRDVRRRSAEHAPIEQHGELGRGQDGPQSRVRHHAQRDEEARQRRGEGARLLRVVVCAAPAAARPRKRVLGEGARDDGAARGEVVEEAAWPTIGRVHGAQEAPVLGEKLAHGRRLHLGEELAAVDGAEVRREPHDVDLWGRRRRTRGVTRRATGGRGVQRGALPASFPASLLLLYPPPRPTLSATTVKPDVCIRSRPVDETRLPVLSK